MDLSIVKSRPKATEAETYTQGEPVTQAETHTQDETDTRAETQTDTQTEPQTETQQTTEKDKVDTLSVSNHEKGKEETFPSFQPFLGNIVITDITTNCLTVTFKEYVTA